MSSAPRHAVPRPSGSGLHVAIIMDGNGRWAQARGLPRTAGHQAGVRAVKKIVEHAPNAGIRALTLYAFSSDNWQRPTREVSALMRLFQIQLARETANLVEKGVRLQFIGRRDRLSNGLRAGMRESERATARGTTLTMRVAVDYSARDLIIGAARRLAADGSDAFTRELFARALAREMHETESAGDVDLLIRTGGEQRLSDFLLWECAYAELYFTEKMWPDFAPHDLDLAVNAYHARERRFGKVAAAG